MATACTAARRGRRGGWWTRGLAGLLVGGGVLLASWTAAWGAPAASKMLEYRPRQEVVCTTPTGDDLAGCKVELVKGKAGSGWVLKDAAGRLVRKFYSSDGRNVDTYSYYKDGVEVYREVVSAGARVPDQFRWLNSGGSKWGVDTDRNGTIDAWKMISAEETSQEVLRALATRDLSRLQSLLITDEEVRALGLPADLAENIRSRRAEIKTKFEATVAKLTKLTDKAVWVHLEAGPPQCLPADETGGSRDILRYGRATVLFEAGGSNEWFQVGPMILVGAAWKIIDAPTPGAAIEEGSGGSRGINLAQDPKLQKLVEELTGLDKKQVPSTGADAAAHHLTRADVLEKIVNLVKPEDRDPWIRQVADSLSSALQANASETTAGTRLTNLEKQLTQAVPTSNLTAYVTFRRLQADYSVKLGQKGVNFAEVQKDWLEKLTGFVKSFPKAEDTPDAMLQLGMVCEFLSKEVEAKNWYSSLARTFADKPQAGKAAGAARRLDLEGNAMPLAGPTLADPNTTYDIEQLRGKVVIVYYWASWNGQAASDLAKLKTLVSANSKDVEMVAINLDATPEEAKEFLTKNPAPGVQLYQQGGLESKLATQYGVMVLPSIFLVAKDGKCFSKASQVNTLEDEIKKHLTSTPAKK